MTIRVFLNTVFVGNIEALRVDDTETGPILELKLLEGEVWREQTAHLLETLVQWHMAHDLRTLQIDTGNPEFHYSLRSRMREISVNFDTTRSVTLRFWGMKP